MVIGFLLTGGASRRMGTDKGRLPAHDHDQGHDRAHDRPHETLAQRTARLLSQNTSDAYELGPGISGLPRLEEDQPGSGPLAAIASGWKRLNTQVHPVVVLATDMPLLTAGLISWLATHPSARSVVPTDDQRPQPLCARYSPADMDTATRLVSEGHRSMRVLLERVDALLLPPELWVHSAGDVRALADMDTPEDAQQLRLE